MPTPGLPMLAEHALTVDPGIVDDDARLTRLRTADLFRCRGYEDTRRAVRAPSRRQPQTGAALR